MKQILALAAAAAAMLAAPALADDPKDPAMRSAAARARDHETIRQLNLAQLAQVRERDAGYAAGWAAVREAGSGSTEAAYQARTREHRQALGDYAAARADYETRMAQWHEQVSACRSGDWDACR